MKNKLKYSLDSYVFAILIAFELLMSFTFLGYVHIPPVSITFAYIPILIAACLLGTPHATLMGIIFGLTSMYKATAYYVMPTDMIFSPFLSGSPVNSVLLSVGTRTLFGFLTGIIFSAAKKQRRPKLWLGIAAAVAPRFHSLIVYLAMRLLFPDVAVNNIKGISLNWSNLIVIVLCIVIVEALWSLYNSSSVCSFKKSIERSGEIPYNTDRKKQIILGLFTAFIVSMTVFAALYFSQRTIYMLNRHGLQVSSEINSDLVHLQIQFTMAVLSLNMISIVILNPVSYTHLDVYKRQTVSCIY